MWLILKLVARTDSSAPVGMSGRGVSGPVRHLETRYLCLQEKVRSRVLLVEKIKGLYNPADLGTKILQGDRVRVLALSISLGTAFLKTKGRPTAALQAGRRLQVTILAALTLVSRGQEVSEAGLVVGEEALAFYPFGVFTQLGACA